MSTSTAKPEPTRAAGIYDALVDNLERIAEHRPPSEYSLTLAKVRGMAAIASELARLNETLDAIRRQVGRP